MSYIIDDSKKLNSLLIVITLCLAFLTWGTIYVWRSVVNKNTAPEQSVIQKYKSCMNSYGATKSEDCKELSEGK